MIKVANNSNNRNNHILDKMAKIEEFDTSKQKGRQIAERRL